MFSNMTDDVRNGTTCNRDLSESYLAQTSVDHGDKEELAMDSSCNDRLEDVEGAIDEEELYPASLDNGDNDLAGDARVVHEIEEEDGQSDHEEEATEEGEHSYFCCSTRETARDKLNANFMFLMALLIFVGL
mmetsp:Transcript_17923/g.39215  ORF Transcript_17923/g.39215 Transcript_17923/m.39215 type:complete len:132 (-) Transcript_17923:2937-3332(-)